MNDHCSGYYLHVVYFNVAVIRSCDEKFGVRGEAKATDGHSMT